MFRRRAPDAQHSTLNTQRSSGFTLVGVVVAIAVLTILIAAVAPTIATIVQRDKEIELIFRGKQYARAILAFQRRFGRYPNKLEELEKIKPRSIRQLWKEPMCNCDDGWTVIIAGTPDAMPMGSGQLPSGGGMPGSGPGGRSRTPGPSTGNQPPSTYTGGGPGGQNPPGGGGPAGGPTPTPAPFSTGIFGQKPEIVGPIVGVKLDKHTKALRKWRDKEYYDEWRFVAGDADNDVMQDPANKPPVFIPTPRK
ncbi:MAG: type II secretion system protein [Thermoanaerobaculia bacterium]